MLQSDNNKVLIVNSHIPWGGLGQFTISLSEGLLKTDHEVYGLITHSDKDNFETFKTFTKSTKYVGHLNKFLKYIAVVQFIWKLKPDVLIINYNGLIHFLLPYLPKMKVISIIHNDVEDFYRISHINHKYVDKWIAPTPGIKKGFLNYVNHDETFDQNTVVISHGIASSNNKRLENARNEFTISFVGAVYKHKGADLLPEILEQVVKQVPNVKLNIIGSGELETSLQTSFKQKGLQGHITFMGVIPHKDVRKILAQSDILLFPTRVEAFGLVIAEAMMEGAVPVVTHLEGITDATIDDDVSGYLIEKNDVDAFANKVISLLTNAPLLQKLSNQAMQQANERLSLSNMTTQYIKLIESINE